MVKYFYILRPHHWVKNLLIFVPILASHNIDETSLIYSFLAFICFSLIASSGYIFNDIIDFNSDKYHPLKKKRLLAAGKISKAECYKIILLLTFVSIIISSQINVNFTYIILIYLISSFIYSKYLKKIIILDIFVLSIFYTLRVYAGSEATNIFISVWLFAFSTFFFLSLAAVKRQIELANSIKIKKTQIKGRGYTISDLPIVSTIAVCSGYISIVIFVLYINSPKIIKLYSNPEFLWGICFILLYWITRLIFLAGKGSVHYDPIVYATKDKSSYICLAIIGLFLIAGV